MPNHVHVVLDKENGHSLRFESEDVLQQRFRESGVDAGHGLVEHHEFGVGHQRTRHFEQLALSTRERSREVILLGVEFESLQNLERLLLDLFFFLFPDERKEARAEFLARLFGAAQFHVVHDGEQTKRLGQLERPDESASCDAVGGNVGERLAVERPFSFVRLVKTREQVEERGLSGAIRPDQRGDRVAGDFDVFDINRDETTELTSNMISDQDGVLFRDARLDFTDVESRRFHRAGGGGLT